MIKNSAAPIDKADPKNGPDPKPNSTDARKSNSICKFYVKGKCRHNENCRFEHPKICFKFRSFGIKEHNEKGCDDENCSFLHPNACRDSLKTKTCTRQDCRFYHLKGTKIISKNIKQNSSQIYNASHKTVATKNRFECLTESNNTKEKQVFHKDTMGDKITLTDIMKELMSIKARQDIQEQKQNTTRSNESNWRHPKKRFTQEQHKAWDSQRRNRSQNSQSQY